MTSEKKGRAYFMTAAELAALGKKPAAFTSSEHLIYSSPATLAFNSPGAQGYGVKRAGLSIPGSVMLLVSPGCCGRNTTILSEMGGYSGRFFYLLMDRTDIVTGRHLKRIEDAAAAVYDSLQEKPGVIVICVTCVDALLGTDMERVCKKASDRVGIPVLPCYMYALTREGRKPPMTYVRQTIYSLLTPSRRVSTTVNLLGNFCHLEDDCELYDILKGMGVQRINEIGRLKTFDEYRQMSQANFNIVLNPDALPAAEDMMKELGIPYIELHRLYRMDKTEKQYRLFASALGAQADVSVWKERAAMALADLKAEYGNIRFAVGEGCNADAFELSLALIEYGFSVREIFAEIKDNDMAYIRKIAKLSPDTKIYSNLAPTMIYYEEDEEGVDISIGKDAGYYHPDKPRLEWSDDVQPFGFTGLEHFFRACSGALLAARGGQKMEQAAADPDRWQPCVSSQAMPDVKGLMLKTSPFAPDQSGAAAVFCQLGGLTVIVDAGGCAGNICGFDEPRWFSSKSAIFSAGLRDMDAILGRDDKLVEKICDVNGSVSSDFTALIGTPVPAVIGTDYRALCRMIEKKTGRPALFADCDGTGNYDQGESQAFLALMKEFASEKPAEPGEHFTGVLGATPMDLGDIDAQAVIRPMLEKRGIKKAYIYTMGAGLSEIGSAGRADLNIVISPAALGAARYLKEKFNTPYEEDFPLEAIPDLDRILEECRDRSAGRILIVAEQMLANALRKRILVGRDQNPPLVRAASWFMMDDEFTEEGDLHIDSEYEWKKIAEEGGWDIIIGDSLFARAAAYEGKYLDLPHFAVSGKF